MGDIAIDIFQGTLKELITSSKLSLIIEEKHQLQSLEEQIKYLRGFLKVTGKIRNDHSEVMKLVKQIRDLVAEAENIVDVVKERMKTLTSKAKEIYDQKDGVAVKQLEHSSSGSGEGSGSSTSNTSKVVKEKVVVGFEEEVNRLIDKLDDRGEDRPLEIISIIGAGGGGKTTLAREVYDHPFTSYTFEIRVWIDVSQDYDKSRKRDLLIRILESVIPGNYEKSRNYEKSSDDKLGEDSDDKLGEDILKLESKSRKYEKRSDDQLGEDILKCLKGRKYLIVLDDIWGIEVWNDIQRSFPKECKGSKVLFTSRLLIQLDSVGYFPHYLAYLPKKWCWELLQKKDDSFSLSAINKHRRLFIGLNFFEEFSPIWPRNLRSYTCFSMVERRYQSVVVTQLLFFAKTFKLLRVLNFSSGSCTGEISIGHLVHLRYLAFASYSFGVRAPPFSYLLNLETLNIRNVIGGVQIKLPHDIFKMVRLRHLYTKTGVFTFHLFYDKAGRNGFDHSSKLNSLQTLHQICACEVCRSILPRTPNLRKLGLYGVWLSRQSCLWPDLEFLKCLEKLTFAGKFHTSKEKILPHWLKLPPTITQICLKCTYLKWEELSFLQSLPSLEVLKLLFDACTGPVWNTSELEGFPQLKYLRFYSLDFKEWNASEDQFPKLEVLALEYCRKLERIPIDFGNLNELREIKLEWCTRSAEESAREIQEEQRNRKGDDDCLNLLVANNGGDWE
ncbi:hypothetical protein Vadar_017320 [Vaccinium darrowii]|uniref:Uncharacterized protein n=1 Tax=Vaccinium darrowii TaxID=229202 RepID=A0ACB7XZT0_9ERIC|nr:hypothetical protein Vadar_017320 [Vaccinium darrowii]